MPLLEVGLVPFFGRFAGGQEANNKLVLDAESVWAKNPALFEIVSSRLGQLAARYRPDLIVPVPSGADGYGWQIANRTGVQCATLQKDAATKQISIDEALDHALRHAERVLIVEDVTTRLSSVRRVLDIPEIGQRAVGVVSVFDRGAPTNLLQLPDGVAFKSLVAEYLPPSIGVASPHYGIYLRNMWAQIIASEAASA